MIDKHVNNPKSPKYYVKRHLEAIKDSLKNKVVIDIPAGSGVTTEILLELGAKVEPYDLFPEYFLLDDVACKKADVMTKIPVDDCYADMVICQEGIEHFSDQAKALRELNRIIIKEGKLLITTPSYSNLKARMSYMLFETEYFNKQMPPNEIDSIWMTDQSGEKEIYYGHIFLIGMQKLRILAKLAGFKISEIHFMRVNKTSLILFPIFYPFVLLSSLLTYIKNMKKNEHISHDIKKAVYLEQLKININPKILLDSHMFVTLTKEYEIDDVYHRFEKEFKPFDQVM